MSSDKKRKLYFDVRIPAGQSRRVFPVTQGRQSFATGDLYGGAVLSTLPALSATSPPGIKRRNMVGAWYAPLQASGALTSTTHKAPVVVDFVAWTCAGKAITAFGIGFTGASGAQLGGASGIMTGSASAALLTQHFAVRVLSPGGDAVFSTRGTLYVERKHSIEI